MTSEFIDTTIRHLKGALIVLEKDKKASKLIHQKRNISDAELQAGISGFAIMKMGFYDPANKCYRDCEVKIQD